MEQKLWNSQTMKKPWGDGLIQTVKMGGGGEPPPGQWAKTWKTGGGGGGGGNIESVRGRSVDVIIALRSFIRNMVGPSFNGG